VARRREVGRRCGEKQGRMTNRTRAAEPARVPIDPPDLARAARLATALSRRGVAPEAVGEVAVSLRTAGLRPVLELGPRVLPDPHAGHELATALQDTGVASTGPHASAVVARWLDGVQMVMTAIGLHRGRR
jgi:hypothetical protein